MNRICVKAKAYILGKIPNPAELYHNKFRKLFTLSEINMCMMSWWEGTFKIQYIINDPNWKTDRKTGITSNKHDGTIVKIDPDQLYWPIGMFRFISWEGLSGLEIPAKLYSPDDAYIGDVMLSLWITTIIPIDLSPIVSTNVSSDNNRNIVTDVDFRFDMRLNRDIFIEYLRRNKYFVADKTDWIEPYSIITGEDKTWHYKLIVPQD